MLLRNMITHIKVQLKLVVTVWSTAKSETAVKSQSFVLFCRSAEILNECYVSFGEQEITWWWYVKTPAKYDNATIIFLLFFLGYENLVGITFPVCPSVIMKGNGVGGCLASGDYWAAVQLFVSSCTGSHWYASSSIATVLPFVNG